MKVDIIALMFIFQCECIRDTLMIMFKNSKTFEKYNVFDHTMRFEILEHNF